MAKPRILQDIDHLYNKTDEVTNEILANQAKLGEFVINRIGNNVKELALHSDITTKLLKIPTDNGNTNQVLTSNGDGTASWKDAQGGDIGYDNAESGLTSTDVQGAIDEVKSQLNQLGLDGVTGRTDSPEVSDSNILATSKAVNTLKTNFQAGVDSVYNAVVAKGSTPASKSLSDVVAGIDNIKTEVSNISWSQIYGNQVHDNAINYTYTATEDCFVVVSALSSYMYNRYDTYGSGSVSSSVSGGAVQKIDIPISYQKSSEYVVTSFVRIFYMPKNSQVTISATARHYGVSTVYVGKLNF